jgi:hypothetical protein
MDESVKEEAVCVLSSRCPNERMQKNFERDVRCWRTGFDDEEQLCLHEQVQPVVACAFTLQSHRT